MSSLMETYLKLGRRILSVWLVWMCGCAPVRDAQQTTKESQSFQLASCEFPTPRPVAYTGNTSKARLVENAINLLPARIYNQILAKTPIEVVDIAGRESSVARVVFEQGGIHLHLEMAPDEPDAASQEFLLDILQPLVKHAMLSGVAPDYVYETKSDDTVTTYLLSRSAWATLSAAEQDELSAESPIAAEMDLVFFGLMKQCNAETRATLQHNFPKLQRWVEELIRTLQVPPSRDHASFGLGAVRDSRAAGSGVAAVRSSVPRKKTLAPIQDPPRLPASESTRSVGTHDPMSSPVGMKRRYGLPPMAGAPIPLEEPANARELAQMKRPLRVQTLDQVLPPLDEPADSSDGLASPSTLSPELRGPIAKGVLKRFASSPRADFTKPFDIEHDGKTYPATVTRLGIGASSVAFGVEIEGWPFVVRQTPMDIREERKEAVLGTLTREMGLFRRPSLADLRAAAFGTARTTSGVEGEMDFFVGMERLDVLDTGRLSKVRPRSEFLEVAAALTALHSSYLKKQLILTDTKPENLAVEAHAGGIRARAIDIGDAATPGAIGAEFTAGYASPEQLRGRALHANTNTWQTGMMVALMKNGQLPYDMDDAADRPLAMMSQAALGKVPATYKKQLKDRDPDRLDSFLMNRVFVTEPEARASLEELEAEIRYFQTHSDEALVLRPESPAVKLK